METTGHQPSSSVVLVFIRRGSIPTQASFSSNRPQRSLEPAVRQPPTLLDAVRQMLTLK